MVYYLYPSQKWGYCKGPTCSKHLLLSYSCIVKLIGFRQICLVRCNPIGSTKSLGTPETKSATPEVKSGATQLAKSCEKSRIVIPSRWQSAELLSFVPENMSCKSVVTYLVCFEWDFTDGIGPETAISGGGTSSCRERSYGPSICLNGHAGWWWSGVSFLIKIVCCWCF